MIVSFRHKGLRAFYETGTTQGIQAAHARKLGMILALLDAAADPQDLDLPALRLHPLKGDLKGHWLVWVNGNWRVTFRFDGNDAEVVDYQDYQ
ncbi:type II toxin-antitoxin system RelE/ParE family toxin [Pelagibacterium luteolum]|uniref:Proteic killer suppression protein n=1 Tax=Pelagibacterium luteolum TaxID=440168 RepID=A0A1G8AGZ2_9HYPH|nr:type II toxin-antitoxin system RelE/ParE family toxin [Pelagibacterium luteolum]SDH20123.1 proteic killer suppression protein [Pelagibacterium luteolum]